MLIEAMLVIAVAARSCRPEAAAAVDGNMQRKAVISWSLQNSCWDADSKAAGHAVLIQATKSPVVFVDGENWLAHDS